MSFKLFKEKIKMKDPFVYRVYSQVKNSLLKENQKDISKEEIHNLLKKDNPTILEIGCNNGKDSQEFLNEFNNIRLFCFEPDPRKIEEFKSKVKDSRCRLYEFALFNNEGVRDFNLSVNILNNNKPADSSTLKQPTELYKKIFPQIKFTNKIKVITRKLDDWASENKIKNIDFIWMDAEGSEREIILGAKNILKNVKYLYTEFRDEKLLNDNPSLSEIKSLLPNFQLVKIYGNNALFSNNFLTKGIKDNKMKKIIMIYPFNQKLHNIYDTTIELLSKNYDLKYNLDKGEIFYKLKSNLILRKYYHFFITKFRKLKSKIKIQKEVKIGSKDKLLFCFNELPPEEFDFILDLEIVTGMSGYEYNKLNKDYISKRLASDKCKAIICWNNSSYLSLTKTIDCSNFKDKIKIIPFAGKDLRIIKEPKKNINLLFVSSINNPDVFETKGGLIALEAYSRLSKKYNNLRFFVRANIKEEIIKKYKNTPGLIFLKSYLSDKKMKELMLNSDILFEPIPGIELLLECMSFAIPAISFNFWCIEEMILNGKSGFLIDSSKIFGSKKNMEEYVKNTNKNYEKLYKVEECNKYVEEFANKCEILIKNRKLLNKMREEQQSFVKIGGKHNMQKRSNNLINLINSV